MPDEKILNMYVVYYNLFVHFIYYFLSNILLLFYTDNYYIIKILKCNLVFISK